jgi:hypothetical protein
MVIPRRARYAVPTMVDTRGHDRVSNTQMMNGEGDRVRHNAGDQLRMQVRARRAAGQIAPISDYLARLRRTATTETEPGSARQAASR